MKIPFILFQQPYEKAYLASYVIWSWISAWQVNSTSYTPFDQIRHTCYNYYVILKKKNLLDFITQKYNPIYICYNCKCSDPDEILVMLRQNSLTAIWVGQWDSGSLICQVLSGRQYSSPNYVTNLDRVSVYHLRNSLNVELIAISSARGKEKMWCCPWEW